MKCLTRLVLATTLALASTLFSLSSHAEDVTVQAVGVKFDPLFVYVEPGDTVSWENMTGHNVETIDAMVPEGTEKTNSELGASVSVTFDQPGIYVYKCTPHWGARMGGIIVVGKPDDSEAVLAQYMAAIEADKSLLPAKGLIKKLKKDMASKGM